MGSNQPQMLEKQVFNARAGFEEKSLVDFFSRKLTKAEMREDDIILEWPEWRGHITHTVLHKIAGTKSQYKGYSIWHQQRSEAEARLYSNENGHILIGQDNWTQVSRVEFFVVQLAEGRKVLLDPDDN